MTRTLRLCLVTHLIELLQDKVALFLLCLSLMALNDVKRNMTRRGYELVWKI